MNDLYRRQLFTDRRAGAQITYQYHDLFREFLLARAEEPYSIDELQALAAAPLRSWKPPDRSKRRSSCISAPAIGGR